MGAEPLSLSRYFDRLAQVETLPVTGAVVRTVGLLVESQGPPARIGDLCLLESGDGEPAVPLEVVGFREGRLLAVPLGGTSGIRAGARLRSRGRSASVPVGTALLGRVVDGLGCPIDGKGPLEGTAQGELHPPPINPLDRVPISAPLGTGVRAIDALLTCGRGQRLGLFGGSGVGKSTLLGMMARGTTADVSVIALVGERGREVRGFLERDLGTEGLRRSVVVVSTSDNPPLMRLRAAYTATAIAEYFRREGRHVLLMMDSVTRFAMAQREVGLAAGEPPTAKGYPPSVFAMLPVLLERAGNLHGCGSITGLYTVLVEGDDPTEPIADSVRAILDGHVVLSRELAARNQYPAIDILHSVSRTMPDVTTSEHRLKCAKVREWMALVRENEDLVSVGAYVPGSNPRIDAAFAKREAIDGFLRQPVEELCVMTEAVEALQAL